MAWLWVNYDVGAAAWNITAATVPPQTYPILSSSYFIWNQWIKYLVSYFILNQCINLLFIIYFILSQCITYLSSYFILNQWIKYFFAPISSVYFTPSGDHSYFPYTFSTTVLHLSEMVLFFHKIKNYHCHPFMMILVIFGQLFLSSSFYWSTL